MTELQKLIEALAEHPDNAGSNYVKNHIPEKWHNKRHGFLNGFEAADAIGFADFCMKNMYDSEFAILTTDELYIKYLKRKG